METVNETLAASKMSSSDGDSIASEGVECTYTPTYGVFVVVLFFQFINWIIRSIPPPKSLCDEVWVWRNITISWLHALICTVWIAFSVVTQPEMFLDLQHYKSYTILSLVTMTTGYFLYDFLEIALKRRMIAKWEVVLHHIAVGGAFYYNLIICEWLSFNIIALSVEVNSFFLHSRKLLQMVGTPYSSRLYRLVVRLNIVTFVIFRGIPLLAISWAMVFWYQRASLAYYVCLAFAMLVMLIMNPILFMRLLRSDFLRKKTKSSNVASHCKASINGNNNEIEKEVNGLKHGLSHGLGYGLNHSKSS